MRSLFVAVVLAVVAALAPSRLAAQEGALRFGISAVQDSTFTFAIGPNNWVKRGQHGFAVDPHRRDALVARFEIVGVNDGIATALITGETTRLTTQNEALLDKPSSHFFTTGLFVAGLALGLAAGFLGGKAF